MAGAGACLALALAAAGCGSGSTPPAATGAGGRGSATRVYERQMKALGATLGASLRLAGETEQDARGSKTARAKDEAALLKAQAALRTALPRLRKIVPPSDVRSAQALLVTGVGEYADELSGVIAKLRAGGAPFMVLQQILAFKGIRDMQRASVEIARHGYDIVAG